MTDIIAPLLPEYTLIFPDELTIWIAWGLWLVMLLVAALLMRDKNSQMHRRKLAWMAILSVLVLVFTPFLGVLPKTTGGIGLDALPVQHLMFLFAIPWMIAAGVVGVFPAVLLAGVAGFLLAYLDTHQFFTPLIFMTFAVIFSWFVRQRYQTKLFRWLRFPLLAAGVSLLGTLPLVFLSLVLISSGSLPIRITAAMSAFPQVSISLSGMVLIGGLFCVFVRAFAHQDWGTHGDLLPAPGEKSLKFQALATLLPILVTLLAVFSVIMWTANLHSARQETIGTLKTTTHAVAGGFTTFVETGVLALLQVAETASFDDTWQIEDFSTLNLSSVSFFNQMFVVDAEGDLLNRDSIADRPEPAITTAIQDALHKESQGASSVIVPILPLEETQSLRYAFLIPISGPAEAKNVFLLGLADLDDNPAGGALTETAEKLKMEGGLVQVLGEDGRVLYHSEREWIGQVYASTLYNTPTYQEVTIGSTPMLQFMAPVAGLDGFVLSALPEVRLFEMAWAQTLPMVLFGVMVIVTVLLVVLISLNSVVKTAAMLNTAATKLAAGNFDIQISQGKAPGEMGQLLRSFSAMIGSLASRVQKQSDLISASEQLAYQDNLQASMAILMKTALAQGVSSIRVALLGPDGETIPDSEAYRFGLGQYASSYAILDQQVLARTHMNGTVVLSDYQAERRFNFVEGLPSPASLISVPVNWQNTFQGVLWVTYQDLKTPSSEDVGFYQALADKVAMAVMHDRAIQETQLVRQRLEALMHALPDAVLMTNESGEVIYHNAAAQRNFAPDGMRMVGKQLFSILPGLDEYASKPEESVNPLEIRFDDGRIYQAIINPAFTLSGKLFQAFLFRDITHQSNDSLIKNEFVTTVSHELRSPLTLIHGYAKILRLTGNLNEQQDATMLKIIDGIEEMKHLVQNLLDIGRLESGASLDISTIDAANLARKVISSMDAQAKQKNIQVGFSPPNVPLMIEGDSTFLTQALRNLVENAIKFTNLGGEVSVSVRQKDNQVVFAIKDNGIGIAPLDQRYLFEKFHRMSSYGGADQSGSGLGLAIVKSIAERHGGQVWFESQLGKGSTFFLQIPQQKL